MKTESIVISAVGACLCFAASAGVLQERIDAVAAAGGGRVTVPAGEWETGPLHLRSNVELHLEEGAVLRFSDKAADYLPAVEVSWEGVECINYSPLIYAYGCTNVAITGGGTLAPRIGGWLPWFRREAPPQREAIRVLYQWSLGRTPLAERNLWKLDAHARPHLIHLNRCRGVRLEDFRIRESPFWCVHLYRSRDIAVRRLDISAMKQNNDGIDVEMCRDVLIEECSFNQGDDAIVLKAGRNLEAREKGEPTENVIVRNCHADTALTLATVGSEMSGGVRHVRISDCSVRNVKRLVHLKTNERRGGEISDFTCERIRAGLVREAAVVIQADALYDEWKKIVPEDISITDIHGITVRDVCCGEAEHLGIIRGDGRRPFGRLLLTNITAGKVHGAAWSVTNAPQTRIESGNPPAFGRARPVWPRGRENELNSHYAFEATFGRAESAPFLEVIAPYPYKAYLNGTFLGAGPARAAKRHYRPDRWPLAGATNAANGVRIEICAYRQGASYCNPDNPAFLAAAVVDGDRTLAETGRDFRAFEVPRVRRTSRYSFQRTFGECWKVGVPHGDEVPLEVRNVDLRLLPRRARYPSYRFGETFREVRRYPVRFNTEKDVRTIDFIDGIVPEEPVYYKGCRFFPPAELEANLWDEMQRIEEAAAGRDGRAVVFDGGRIRTGFLSFRVNCTKPGRLYALFDELLTPDGDVDPKRLQVANAVRWDIVRPGAFEIETFEPYEMRAVRFVMLGGEAEVAEPRLRLVRSPAADTKIFDCPDEGLRRVFEAAHETFAQNAVDVFTDCPGRERAGWLCDSWFTARASEFFTGTTELETLFLENFLLAEDFGPQPKGMFPSCYPSEVPNGRYIPNWAFWLALELAEYAGRGGDRALVDAFRPKMDELLAFFARYENADGLLERLPGWIFVEWSQANKLVQDVNYPSNMTYAKVLEDLAKLYGRSELAEKAKRVRAAVLRQSWNGEWFCDNAVRGADGALRPSGECTEACQYYAFFFGTATRASHPELWRRLTEDFGPDRKASGRWRNVWPANAFIGNYMRLELLSDAGLHDQVVREIRGYFLKMAERTGTLWEHDSPTASCCHGFASYVAVLLDRSMGR